MSWDDTKVDGSSSLSASEYNTLVSEVKKVHVAAGEKVYLNGDGSTTYFTFNSGTGKVELYVGGVKKASWG